MDPKEEIKSRLNIVDVVQSYVRLTKAGAHWKGLCPFHAERTPSFVVNEERGMWHCFGCNKGGDVFAFVMDIDNLEFREALELLADRAGVELPAYNREAAKVQKTEKENMLEMLEWSVKFFEKQLWEGAGKEQALKYIQARGISDESIKKFRLGYSPDGWRYLHDFLLSKGYDARLIEKAGLIIAKSGQGGQYYDRFRNRLMFPIQDVFGRTLGFSARVLPGLDETTAKYINTPETSLYHKGSVLYGIFQAKLALKQHNKAILVEGNMDVIALSQAGFENVVAVSGTALTAEQLKTLRRYAQHIEFFFDMDTAGQQAAHKSTEMALSFEITPNIVALPQGKDAADLAQENPTALKQALEQSTEAPRYFLDQLVVQHDITSAAGKRAVVEGYTGLLSSMQHPIDRSHWTHVLSERIGVPEESIESVVRKTKTDTPQQPKGTEIKNIKSVFDSRKELLVNELVSYWFAYPKIWHKMRENIHPQVKAVIDTLPVNFFLFQSTAGSDPQGMITDERTKEEVTKRIFSVIQKNEDLSIEAVEEKIRSLTEELHNEVLVTSRLKELEEAMRRARQEGNKAEEQVLLVEFMSVSQQGMQALDKE